MLGWLLYIGFRHFNSWFKKLKNTMILVVFYSRSKETYMLTNKTMGRNNTCFKSIQCFYLLSFFFCLFVCFQQGGDKLKLKHFICKTRMLVFWVHKYCKDGFTIFGRPYKYSLKTTLNTQWCIILIFSLIIPNEANFFK